jgi:hypothetical protein
MGTRQRVVVAAFGVSFISAAAVLGASVPASAASGPISASASSSPSSPVSYTPQPTPTPSAIPSPIAGLPGDYYVTCFASNMTPACQNA